MNVAHSGRVVSSLRGASAASLLAVATLLTAASPALAQAGARPKADPAPAGAPQAAKQGDPQAVIDAFRRAIADRRAISYKIRVSAEGAGAESLPTYTAAVTQAKAEAGGWRVHAKGESAGRAPAKPAAPAAPAAAPTAPDAPAAAPAEPAPGKFEIGFDGVVVRSVREKEKAVVERSINDKEELSTFFGTQAARPAVVWEMLDEEPLKDAAGAVHEGNRKWVKEDCAVIFVPSTDPAAAAAGAGTRWFFAAADGLPRRIERISTISEPNAPAGSKPRTQTRAAVLSDVRVDEKVTPATYALAVPDGYRVRAGEVRRASGSRGQRLGDPERKRETAKPQVGLAVGSAAPDWTLTNGTGQKRSLADYKGKVVVMDFWGTWCGWCIKAMPQIQAVHEHYKDKPVAILGMNVENDPSADPLGFMKKSGYTYEQIMKAESITSRYKVTGYPFLYVIDQDGKVLEVEVGYSANLKDKLIETIDKALAGKGGPKDDATQAPASGG
jgi:thiol-disulfide isomerase/thioredoxin